MNIHNNTGQAAETRALHYLKKRGLIFVQRNFQCRFGEIDLIMQDTHSLIFIEVKFRTNINFGHGSDFIHSKKQNKIIKTASLFLQNTPPLQKKSCRFDVVSIRPSKVEWIKNAFILPSY